MGCALSSASFDAPFEVVGKVFQLWGEGEFNNENALKNTQEYFLPDWRISAARISWVARSVVVDAGGGGRAATGAVGA